MRIIDFIHYNLRAPRDLLDALRSFYTEVVGLEQGERPPFTRFGYWLYAGSQDVLHLTEASPEEIRSVEAVTTFDHASFNCTGRKEIERSHVLAVYRQPRAQTRASAREQGEIAWR